MTFNSFLFGFIDDMYLIVRPYANPLDESQEWRVIDVQAQIRLGKADFDLNQQRVHNLLTCLNTAYENSEQEPRPCSQ